MDWVNLITSLVSSVFLALGVVALRRSLSRREPRTLAKLAATYGLKLGNRSLEGNGLCISMTTEDTGRHRLHYINYRLPLPDFPSSMSLHREGATSGSKFNAGASELTCGDVDFDDLIWFECPDPKEAGMYLQPHRIRVLTELFWRLPEAVISEGCLSGKVGYSASRAAAVVSTCICLRAQLEGQEEQPVVRAPGWVNRYQRRYYAVPALVVGLTMGFLAAGLRFLDAKISADWGNYAFAGKEVWPIMAVQSGMAVVASGRSFGFWCLVFLSAMLVCSSMGLLTAAAWARGLMLFTLRLMQILGCITMFGVVFLVSPSPDKMVGMLLMVGFLGLVWYFGLEQVRHALYRVRCGFALESGSRRSARYQTCERPRGA